MNTGVDAVNLAWGSAPVLNGRGDNLLDSYELERIGFATTGRYHRSHFHLGDGEISSPEASAPGSSLCWHPCCFDFPEPFLPVRHRVADRRQYLETR